MKSFKGTLVFAALVAGLVAYAYFFEFKKGEEEEKQKEQAARLFAVEQDKIDEVTVTTKTGSFDLKRAGTTWKIFSPTEDFADVYAVNSLLSVISTEKSEETVAEGAEADPNVFGFTEPMGTIKFKAGDQSGALIVSQDSAIGGRRYAMREGEAKVLLIGYGPEGQVNKTSLDLRSKRAVNSILSDSERLSIEGRLAGQRSRIQLKMVDGKWKMLQPIEVDADNASVSAYFTQLEGLSANAIVSDKRDDGAELKKRLLSSPTIVVETTSKDGKTFRLEVGAQKDSKTHVRVSDRTALLEFPQAATDALVKGPDDFRDRKAPFRFEKTSVSQIHVQSSLAQYQILKGSKDWQLETAVPGKVLAVEQVETLLESLSALEVKHYLGTGAGAKLDPARGEVVLKDSKGNVLLSLKWIDDPKNPGLYFARSNLSTELIHVESSRIAALPMQTLVAEPTPTPAPTAKPSQTVTPNP